jgi:3-methyladenine DNA glycosylase AlkD
MNSERKDIISSVRKSLKLAADGKAREAAQRFFKEPIKCYGMKSAIGGRIAKDAFKEVKGLSKSEVFALCEDLLASGWLEEAGIGAQWAYQMRKGFEPADFRVFERWVSKYIDNWAKCDTLCNHTIGAFIEQYPQFIDRLKVWAKSKNRWVRRAAAVTLIVPAKRGMFLPEVFEIADLLLMDGDDMVQKGYGWMLKEASRKHQKEVLEFVVARKDRMPRTALRYAIEKMPQDLRKKAMSKRH